MNRRDLIRKVVLGSTAMAVLPSAITGCSEKDDNDDGNGGGKPSEKLTLDLTNQTYAALNSAGGFVIIAAKEIIVVNTGNNVFIALSSKCTHDGCSVTYNAANKNFPCPCHQSLFASTGAVINGPAATALKSYTITKAGNILTITL
ncbi:MAG TPA: hypothetical protein DDW27_10720 [Bacteroidales bacterium]|nr:hypothetical protein [Bacteroidales bacterium]